LAQRSLASVSREAYLGLGGRLPPLPATAKECERIARVFQGGKVTVLQGEQATERGVRDHIAGCRFIHLAAHGLVDQQHDNLFGAIALTPPAQGVDSAEDDGFHSLHEIHDLPLSGCQLAVLSACQTNVGPDRPLEAGSTLAQAFLAAGARRAVCSHWSVDDASTAELMGTFFEQIAKAAKQYDSADKEHRDPIEYAAALHEAQKRVRSQPQWSSPYYWTPLVLIGPPQ
jgi:CHAT domain-containing protein